MTMHPIASREDWTAARLALLAKEKEFTRARDALSAARRELPWEKVETDYVFEGANGPAPFADLFAGKSQLIVYHFMYDTGWEAGCKSCSFWGDNFARIVVHLNHRDTNLVLISRAPYARLADYQKRMGWSFDWFSSLGNSFNHDYAVSFTKDVGRERTPGTTISARVISAWRKPPASACSRAMAAPSSTRTRPIRAASTCSTAPITCSISCPRAATKRT